jgi:hypothetical protein
MFKPLIVSSQLVARNVGETHTPGSQPSSLPANRSTSTRPAIVDPLIDSDLQRLWRDWDVRGKGVALGRALSADERFRAERRCAELEAACAPFTPAERDLVVGLLSGALGGFRALRHEDDESVVASLAILLRILAPFPLWAIEDTCLAIGSDEAVLDGKKLSRSYPPNDAEVCALVKAKLEPYLDSLQNARALLAAPVIERARPKREPDATPSPAPTYDDPLASRRRFVQGDELNGWRVIVRMLGQSDLTTHTAGAGDGIWMTAAPQSDLVAMSRFVHEHADDWQIAEEGTAQFAAWRDRLELWLGKAPRAQKIWLEALDPKLHRLSPLHPDFRLRRSTNGFRVPAPLPPNRDGTWEA